MSESTFAVSRTVYRLEFDGEDHAGMVVRVRKMTLRDVFDLEDVATAWEAAEGVEKRTRLAELHQAFLDHVVDWNLVDDDGPIPVTLSALYALEPDLIGLMVGAWRAGRAPGSVPAPLDEGSTSGEVESTLVGIPVESLAS